jgi:hypothetical protein
MDLGQIEEPGGRGVILEIVPAHLIYFAQNIQIVRSGLFRLLPMQRREIANPVMNIVLWGKFKPTAVDKE